MTKQIVEVLILSGLALLAWKVGSFLVRLKFPLTIPASLGFEHELTSEHELRRTAEILAGRFPGPTPDGVVCLGVVRGTAARVLFHSGPVNPGKNVNLYRRDYVLSLRRLGKTRVALTLGLNRPYSYPRLRRSELDPLVAALRAVHGAIASV